MSRPKVQPRPYDGATRAGGLQVRPKSTIGAIALACCVLESGHAQAEYPAYSIVDGVRAPLPESIHAIDASYLVELDWNYRGGRSMITIQDVQDVHGVGAGAHGVSVAGIGEVIAEALRRTGRFTVRDNAPGTDNGADATSRRARTLGADRPGRDSADMYVPHAGLADYAEKVAGAVSNPRAVRSRERPADGGLVALDLRLLDAAGRVVLAGQFKATIKAPRPAVTGFGDVGGFASDIWTRSIGQAILAAVNRGTFEILKAVGPLPLSGRIVRAEGDRVWINLGRGSVSVGDMLDVTSAGETLVDPETGLDLGALEEKVGTVRVSQVAERFSIAETVSASAPPTQGDSVRSALPPPEFEFAPDWQPPAPKPP